MVKKLKEIFDILKGEEKLILSVAAAEDKEVLKGLSKLLGKTDINGQINEIKLVSNFLDTQIQIAQKEKEKNEKMYKTLRHDNWTCYCYCISLDVKERRV